MRERKHFGANLTDDPDDSPELLPAFFEDAEIRKGDQVIRRGRPPSGKAKQLVSLRIDVEVLERLRNLGPGWQTRATDALRELADNATGLPPEV
jgi:uncharacterized protein (DUF4415 family)